MSPIVPFPQEKVASAQRLTDEVHSVAATGTLNHTETTWLLPEEVPIAIQLNSANYAVMMGTPADLEDFGVGFALSEGLVDHASHISNVLAMPSGDGFTVDLAGEQFIRERMISRTLEGRVGCGLCGIEEMADVICMPDGKLKPVPFSADAVARAFEALPRFQPMNAENRTVHAAAWANVNGDILLAREDVGRHNALDKLIGAMARRNISARDGFVVMSSRCSFELVQKCARVGIAGLATVSAPTALAHRLAGEAGLKLAAMAKDGVMVFDGN
jgi:FdhD protein